MGKNTLADIANTMPNMIAGRMGLEDWETLAVLPDGVLSIDLLAETAHHSIGGVLSLRVVLELARWLKDRLAATQLLPSDLTKVELVIAIRTDRVPVDRSRIIPFDLVCTGTFSTKSRTCSSKPARALRWYTRDERVSD
jgi:hypothetical protein